MSSQSKSRSSPLHKESTEGILSTGSSNHEFFTTLNDAPCSQRSLDIDDVFKTKATSPIATIKKTKKAASKSKESGHATRHKSKSLELNPSTHSKQGKASTKKTRSLDQHLHMENNKDAQRLTTASRTIATDPTEPLSPSESYESLLGSKTFSKLGGSSPAGLPPPPPPPISSPSYHGSPFAPSVGKSVGKSPGWKLRESYKHAPRKETSPVPSKVRASLPAALQMTSLSSVFVKSTSTRKMHTGGKHDKWDSGDKGIDTLTTSKHSRSGRSSRRLTSNSGHGTPLSSRRKKASTNHDSMQCLSTTPKRRSKGQDSTRADAPAPHEVPGVQHHMSSGSLKFNTSTPKPVVDRVPHIVAWESNKSDHGVDEENASVGSFDSTLTPSVASRDQKDSEDEYEGPDHKWNDLPLHQIPWASPTNHDPIAPGQVSQSQHNPLPSPPFQSPQRPIVSDSSPSIPLRPRSLRLTDQDAIIEEITSNSELAEARFENTLNESCQLRESLVPPQRQVSRPERDDHKKEKHSHAAEVLISKITQMNDELRIKNTLSGCDSSKCSERHLPSHPEETDGSDDESEEPSHGGPAMKPRKSLESIDRKKSKKAKDVEAAVAEKKAKKTSKRDSFKKEGSKRRLMKKEASQKGLDTEQIIDPTIPLPTVFDMSPEVTASLKKSKDLDNWAKDFSASNHSAKASGFKKSKSVRNITSGSTKPKSMKHISTKDSGDKDGQVSVKPSDSVKPKSVKNMRSQNVKSKSTRSITSQDVNDMDDGVSVKSSDSIKLKSSRSITSESSKTKSTKSKKRDSLSKHLVEEDSNSVDDASVSSNHSQVSRATCPDLSSGRGRSKLEKSTKSRVKSRSQSPSSRKKRQPKSLVEPEKLAPWQIKQQLKHRVTPVVSLYNRRLDDDDDEDVPPAFRNSKKSKKPKKNKSIDSRDSKSDVDSKRNAVIGALAKFSRANADVPPAFKVGKK